MTQDNPLPDPLVLPAAPLPLVTAHLPGIGGRIRESNADFVVEELPLYEPAGEGEHVYVRLVREGMATRDLVERLRSLFRIPEVDLGYAGLKDKQAVASQTFSLRLPQGDADEVARRVAGELPSVRVEWARRHRNKLRKGHLLGNRFRVVVRDAAPDAEVRARAIVDELRRTGLPNYYGEQRFGRDGENVQRGREALAGRGPRARWLRDLLLSALQSRLFNEWLANRIRRGDFGRLLPGDVARKSDTGGLFDVLDAEVERPRFERNEISYTGPIYGGRMRWATGQAGEHERALLSAAGIAPEQFARVRLDGSRRHALLRPIEVTLAPEPGALALAFSLPKGAYATVLLRELRKVEGAGDDAGTDDAD